MTRNEWLLCSRARTRLWIKSDRLPALSIDPRQVAIAVAGFRAFLPLYSPHALLPALPREFAVGPARISSTMTAGTLAVALTAAVRGAVVRVLGRHGVPV